VEAASGQLDLRPLEVAQLGCPQAMAVAEQDHGGIAMGMAARLPRGHHQPLDFGRRQVQVQVLAGANCSDPIRLTAPNND
jgi:hypothetical protein